MVVNPLKIFLFLAGGTVAGGCDGLRLGGTGSVYLRLKARRRRSPICRRRRRPTPPRPRTSALPATRRRPQPWPPCRRRMRPRRRPAPWRHAARRWHAAAPWPHAPAAGRRRPGTMAPRSADATRRRWPAAAACDHGGDAACRRDATRRRRGAGLPCRPSTSCASRPTARWWSPARRCPMRWSSCCSGATVIGSTKASAGRRFRDRARRAAEARRLPDHAARHAALGRCGRLAGDRRAVDPRERRAARCSPWSSSRARRARF